TLNPWEDDMKSIFYSAVTAACISVTSLPVCAQDWSPGEPYTITVAGSQPQQSIYAIGVAHKQLIEEALPGVRIDILATQGGNENVQLMMLGEAQMSNANSI